MRILIVTGIYPPEIGGPAEYAKNLEEVWVSQGYQVSVKIFGRFKKIPWGVRHIVFFLYILPSVVRADYIVTLDAFFHAGMFNEILPIYIKLLTIRRK